MKVYIVTETNTEDNIVLRSWVCFTKAQADECLKKQYDIACTYNCIAGVENPIDCLDNNFFFWRLKDGMELRYRIEESKTFAD